VSELFDKAQNSAVFGHLIEIKPPSDFAQMNEKGREKRRLRGKIVRNATFFNLEKIEKCRPT